MLEDNYQSIASNLIGTELTSLYDAIDKNGVYGLNLTVPEDAKAVIKPWDQREDTTKFADSGVDDQLILHIPFMESVRLKSILVKIGRGEYAPRQLDVFANNPSIVDFDQVENTKPHLCLSLLEGETSVIEYPVRIAAFASITSLSLFFSKAVGAERSRIYYIGFKGDLRSSYKEPNTKIEIPAENAADASLVQRSSEKIGGQRTTAR